MEEPLKPEVVDRFIEDGVVLVPGLFERAAVERLRSDGHDVLDRLRRRGGTNGAWSTVDVAGVPTGQAELRHCHDLQLHSAAFSRALLDARFVGAMAQLLASPDVQLHHNKLFVKPPRQGAPFPMHQDWPFFPHEADSPMAAIVHLDDATVDNGCVHVVPGSHRSGRQHHVGERDWYLSDNESWRLQSHPFEAHAGDVLFFNYLSVHGSGPNRTSQERTTWLVQVRDANDRPTVDRHRSPGQGTMLTGVNTMHPPPPTSFGAS